MYVCNDKKSYPAIEVHRSSQQNDPSLTLNEFLGSNAMHRYRPYFFHRAHAGKINFPLHYTGQSSACTEGYPRLLKFRKLSANTVFYLSIYLHVVDIMLTNRNRVFLKKKQ